LHMCGHIKKLLPIIRETELDGIHALTAPPVGDTYCEDVLDLWGNKNIFLMPCFDPVTLNQCSAKQISDMLDRFYTPRLREAHIILCLFVDGIDVPLDKLEIVSEWFCKNGTKN